MMFICENAKTRVECKKCKHSIPHEYDAVRGCEHGFCFPPITDEEGTPRQQNYKCVEAKELIDGDIQSPVGSTEGTETGKEDK